MEAHKPENQGQPQAKEQKPENQKPPRTKEQKQEDQRPHRRNEQDLQVRIRPMEPADAAQMAQIGRQSFADPWSAEAFLGSGALPYTCFLVAEVLENTVPPEAESEAKAKNKSEMPLETEKTAGSPVNRKLAGYCGSYCSRDEAEIVCVAVEKCLRRKGLGRRMLLRLLESSTAMGVTAFTLEVRASNAAAIALYQSLGFQMEGIRRRFYENPVEDAYVMVRRLPETGSNSH